MGVIKGSETKYEKLRNPDSGEANMVKALFIILVALVYSSLYFIMILFSDMYIVFVYLKKLINPNIKITHKAKLIKKI